MSVDKTLRIKNVSKQYHVGSHVMPVLDNITLTVARGEFVSIVGPSGCGKSTLLRLVIGLENDYQGTILLDGQTITGPSLTRGIVFQEHRLLPWLTVEANIGLGLEVAKMSLAEKAAAIREHLDLVGLRDFAKAYPYQLSGGMAQRAAIARALVNKPEILLLDEPLGALDAFTRNTLQQELLRIWQQERLTVILVTHDVEEAVYLGDKIVIMHPRPGRIQEVIPAPFPHPRNKAHPEFVALKQQVLSAITDGAG
jgi:sulfonate transport system ATP-binding protein